MDFAIIETSGRQYKITPDSTLELDKIDKKEGEKIIFDKVLMVVSGDDINIGNPYLDGVSYEAELVEQKKGKKIHIRRFKAKSRYRRHIGFRPSISKVSMSKKTSTAKVAKSK
jgi:large subunit ribosomal protein L21